MKVYKLAKGWAIFVYIFAPLLIALFVWLAVMPFTSESEGMSRDIAWFFVPVSIFMVSMMVYGLVDAIKGKVIIDGNTIIQQGVFRSRELTLQEIKGYRVVQNYILIEPSVAYKKKLKISLTYGKTNEILAWLGSYHADLEAVQHFEESQEILANEQFGDTADKRAWNWDNAKQLANYINWGGIGVGLWAMFYPNFYLPLLIGCMVIPLICVLTIKLSKGLIRLDGPPGSAYPTIGGAMFVTAGALALRAVLDFSVFDHSHVWLPVIIITIVLMAILILVQQDFNFREKKHQLFVAGFLLLSFAYAYGAVVFLNCYFDRSTPEAYEATVLKKNKSSTTSGTSYYLYVSPWEKVKEEDRMEVPRSVYERVDTSDVVSILYYKGKFNIPWIRVTP